MVIGVIGGHRGLETFPGSLRATLKTVKHVNNNLDPRLGLGIGLELGLGLGLGFTKY